MSESTLFTRCDIYPNARKKVGSSHSHSPLLLVKRSNPQLEILFNREDSYVDLWSNFEVMHFFPHKTPQLPLLKLLAHVFFSLGWISHEQLLTALLLVTLVGYIHYSRQEDITEYLNTWVPFPNREI
jgi:hypothetical protein